MHQMHKYRGIKLLEHAMKVMERVIEGRVRKIVKIDNLQFGFLARKSLTDAIFINHRLQEKYLARTKYLWMVFVDLEKTFDRVSQESRGGLVGTEISGYYSG